METGIEGQVVEAKHTIEDSIQFGYWDIPESYTKNPSKCFLIYKQNYILSQTNLKIKKDQQKNRVKKIEKGFDLKLNILSFF